MGNDKPQETYEISQKKLVELLAGSNDPFLLNQMRSYKEDESKRKRLNELKSTSKSFRDSEWEDEVRHIENSLETAADCREMDILALAYETREGLSRSEARRKAARVYYDEIKSKPTSSSSGCFIATAAYGSPLAPELDVFRYWRDSSLMTNSPGRTFCSLYYTISPPIAKIIEKSEKSKAIVRALLNPFLKILKGE